MMQRLEFRSWHLYVDVMSIHQRTEAVLLTERHHSG